METVVAAALIIILVLLSMLTLTYACISAQTGLLESWRAMDERALERSRTSLSPVGAGMEATGDVVTITLKNDGSVKLSDLRQWDVVLEYVTPTGRMAGWYPYAQAADPGQNQWALQGIYHDAAKALPEVQDPGIVNPGEELVIRVKVSPPVKVGTAGVATVSTPNGIAASLAFVK